MGLIEKAGERVHFLEVGLMAYSGPIPLLDQIPWLSPERCSGVNAVTFPDTRLPPDMKNKWIHRDMLEKRGHGGSSEDKLVLVFRLGDPADFLQPGLFFSTGLDQILGVISGDGFFLVC